MNNSMKIELTFLKNTFEATAYITLHSPQSSFSFILNNDLNISEITCNDNPVSFKKIAEEKFEFRSPAQRIAINCNNDIHNIVIQYSGSIDFSVDKMINFHNIITDEFESLSWYSVWYPQETSVEIQNDKVILLHENEYFLVKGIYNEVDGVWEYGNQGYDPYNIVVYNKKSMKKITSPYINIYFIDDSIEKHAKKLEILYKEILEFYNGNLFAYKDTIGVLDIACASPAIAIGGGYRRKDFMWCVNLGNNDIEIAWQLAHETAHIWCIEADWNTWEDWLNETTAEWATLLFAVKKEDMDLFDFIMKPKLEMYDTLPPIKTVDGSRPQGVHHKGSVLFYEIYKLYGKETVRNLVRMISDLEHTNTDALLKKLYASNPDVAKFIEEGLLR